LTAPVDLFIDVVCPECSTTFRVVVGLGDGRCLAVFDKRGVPVKGNCPKCDELIELRVSIEDKQ
jgi:phage FluMu protein Com